MSKSRPAAHIATQPTIEGGIMATFTRVSTAVAALLISGGITALSAACETSVDVHPTSCPNPVNIKSNGLVPAAILGTGDFDVHDINISAGIKMQLRSDYGVAGTPFVYGYSFAYEDVSTPEELSSYDSICDLPKGACNEYGPDGYPDLTLKFPVQGKGDSYGVSDLLMGFEKGDAVTVIISWTMNNGREWFGRDVVVVNGVNQ